MTIDARRALRLCLQANVPTIVWGPPGVGKTTVITSIAKELGLHLEVVIASIREPSDFAGLPFRSGDSVQFAPPVWAQNIVASGGGMVFYDEISTAPPSVQAALLRPILDGVVGDLRLPSGTRTVAAANPTEQAAGGWDLSLPLANRFCHLEWDVSPFEVAQGFTTGWHTEKDSLVATDLQPDTGASLAKVGAFLLGRPNLVVAVPSAASDTHSFPTPRSWEMAARLLAYAETYGASHAVIDRLIAGCVGAAAASEFLSWSQRLDIPNPAEILSNPQSWTPPAGRGDLVHATLGSTISLVKATQDSIQWTALGTLIANVARAGYVDVAYNASRTWMDIRPTGAVPSPSVLIALQPLLAEMQKTPNADQ